MTKNPRRTELRHKMLQLIADNPLKVQRIDGMGAAAAYFYVSYSGHEGHGELMRAMRGPGMRALHQLWDAFLLETDSKDRYRPGIGRLSLTRRGAELLKQWDKEAGRG